MCGIAGKIYFNKGVVTQNDLDKMTNEIAHRGPDDSGSYISENRMVGLGNRRLAIIDLSPKGHQPMFFKKGRYVITTNSEIYNYQEEKKKLKNAGYKFNSDCDTEVVLALYDKYGEKCLEHMRGMFAFCIYDTKDNTLFLARDRIGKKPLKYYLSREVFIFSSEVKAILTQKEVRKEPDFTAIAKYLIYGYIPSPLTGFRNIKKLEPGHFIKINLNNKTFDKKLYWQPDFSQKQNLSEKEWCREILSTLSEATKLRLISDAPLGAFLSGGVDSSAVVATMAKLSKTPVKTFTITFKDRQWDESRFAQNIVKMYKTNHTNLAVEPLNIEMLPQISQNFEEPFADGGVVLSYMVSELARKHVSVALNGDGGDELFAGYPNRHNRLKRDVDYKNFIKLFRPPAETILKILGIKNSKLKKFLDKSKLPFYERFASYNQIFAPNEIKSLTLGKLNSSFSGLNNPYEEVEKVFLTFEGNDPKDAGLMFDLLYWLPDDLLAKADMTSMANSLESRSPLLDVKMIDLAGQIPFNLKVKNKESKYIFKKALEKIIPIENLYRPKRGFGLPLHKWFSGKTNDYARSVLLSKNTRIDKFIKTDEISKMFEGHGQKNDFGPRLWSLLTLELWYRNYFK